MSRICNKSSRLLAFAMIVVFRQEIAITRTEGFQICTLPDRNYNTNNIRNNQCIRQQQQQNEDQRLIAFVSTTNPIIRKNRILSLVNLGASKQNDNTIEGDDDNEEEEDDDDEYDDGDDEDYDEFIVTSKQIKILRKEADQRRANGRLVVYLLPIHETSKYEEYDDETIDTIGTIFATTELTEIRGIGTTASTSNNKADRRYITQAAEQLAYDVANCDNVERPVIVVEVRGHRAVLYSPAPEEDTTTDRILLRSSYRPNQWKKRPRGIRDYRGQIMKDEDGNIIRQ